MTGLNDFHNHPTPNPTQADLLNSLTEGAAWFSGESQHRINLEWLAANIAELLAARSALSSLRRERPKDEPTDEAIPPMTCDPTIPRHAFKIHAERCECGAVSAVNLWPPASRRCEVEELELGEPDSLDGTLFAELQSLRAEVGSLRREREEARKDAERWRAFLASGRIRILGTAGIPNERGDGYAHMGLEIWTKVHPTYAGPPRNESADLLTQYADIMLANLRASAPSKEGSQ